MSEPIRALIAILALTLPVWWLARKPMTELAFTPREFAVRRNLWIALTVTAFVAHSFWFYLAVMVLMLSLARVPQHDRLALFLALLFVVPVIRAEIPGFGGVRYIIALDHVRALVLLLLLPAWLVLRGEPNALPFGRLWIDRAVAAYAALALALQWSAGDSFTNILRNTVYQCIDILLPYAVASRALRSVEAFRKAMMSFVLASLLMAAVGAFEFVKRWLLYNSLSGAWGQQFGFGRYLNRGEDLRALASAGHSIVMGYLFGVALSFHQGLRRAFATPKWWNLAMAGLVVGVVVPIARGPWMGVAASVAVILLTGPERLSRTARFAAIALPLLAGLLISPLGDKVIDRLPFIGTVDKFNVDYRARLVEVSISVILQNPWFGSYDFLFNPLMEEMRQGEGIIDIVNSYLAVALAGGVISLALFASIFALAWIGLARRLNQLHDKEGELHLLGRALLAALTGIMITIATVSSIQAVPYVYWCAIGLCVGFVRLPETVNESTPIDASNPRTERSPFRTAPGRPGTSAPEGIKA